MIILGLIDFFEITIFFLIKKNELSTKEFYKSWIQFLIYIFAISISFIYVKLYNQIEIKKDSEYLSNFSAYIIR